MINPSSFMPNTEAMMRAQARVHEAEIALAHAKLECVQQQQNYMRELENIDIDDLLSPDQPSTEPAEPDLVVKVDDTPPAATSQCALSADEPAPPAAEPELELRRTPFERELVPVVVEDERARRKAGRSA